MVPEQVKARLKRSSHLWGLMFIPSLTVGALATSDSLLLLGAVAALQAGLLYALPGVFSPQISWPHSALQGGKKQVTTRFLADHLRAENTANVSALVLCLDEGERLKVTYGTGVMTKLLSALAERLEHSLRGGDSFALLDTTRIGVALIGQKRGDFGTVVSVAQRLQARLSGRYEIEDTVIHATVSVGFCLSRRAAHMNGLSLLEAAEQAARKAAMSGPGGLNSFSVVDFPSAINLNQTERLQEALENGEIRPHFQPQVRTDTGEVSGFEALARWEHPERGLISPGEFLPQIEASGLSAKLARNMLVESLRMLASLENGDAPPPTVSVNLSSEELRNPRLADEIAWDLDRYDLPPERLTLEILETVVAHGDDDIAVRTIARLATMGCGIDLDDFGTGHASLAHIRQFAVNRIKIDRSFVTHMADDPDHQRMVAAILSMAAQLGLATLAEGIETPEVQIMLAQMGCEHLQGFGIARPMPAEALPAWLTAHRAALAEGEPWCEDTDHSKRA